MSIFQKLLITFIAVAIAPLTFSFYIAQSTASELIVSQNAAETVNSLVLVSNSISSQLERIHSLAMYVNDDENIRTMLIEDIADSLNAAELSESTLRLRQLDRVNRFARILNNISYNMIGVRSYITIASVTDSLYTSWSYEGAFSEIYNPGAFSGDIWTGFERNYVISERPQLPYVWTIGKNIIRADRTHYGTFVISVSEQSIGNLLAVDSRQNRAVLDGNGKVISATRKDWIDESFETLYESSFSDAGSGSFMSVDESGERLLISYVTMRDWKVVDVKDYDSIVHEMNLVRNRLFMLNALSALALVIMAAVIARGISKPLRRLAALMQHTDLTNPSVGERQATRDEVGILEESFHVMVNKNKDLMERNIESERKKRGAELKALQAQISPHFLFNTLNCIRWAAINNNNKKAADMVLALSSLLRMTVINDDEFITVETELGNLHNYAALFQMRQAVEFTFTETIPEELRTYRLPKLLLQPLVENSLIHGFEGMTEGGVITVTGEVCTDGVYLRITDNGVGMDTDELHGRQPAKATKFSGIGVHNVDERIKLNFGEQYGLRLNSSPGGGTTAEVYLPPIDAGDEND